MVAASDQAPGYTAHGAANQLFYCRDPEVLLEGPAGTGKTRGALELVNWACESFPGIRVLLCRKTRASMTESVLVTWEDKVLRGTKSEACITGSAQRNNRQHYTYPHATALTLGKRYSGESHVVVGGLDKASRIMSTEYDLIVVFEANEITEADWEMLLSRNRNWVMPWQQAICDTNPDFAGHWLNRRGSRPYEVPDELKSYMPPAREGQTQMTRLLSRHTHNPMLWDMVRRRWTPEGALYMSKLSALTGARLGRLKDGLWVGAEGQIWECFDMDIHMVHRELLDENGHAAKDGHPRNRDGSLKCDWYFGAMDWGHRDPGVLQIWGVVGRFERMYRLHEIYRTGEQLDWWAKQVVRFDERYELSALVCDPSRPENIETMNSRICDFRGRKMAHVAIGANNAREAGWDMVRFALDPGASARVDMKPGDPEPDMAPLMYLCWHVNEEIDSTLLEAELATCTEEEIPGYVWKKASEGHKAKEEPDPLAPDHGCDTTRYAAVFVWENDLVPDRKRAKFDLDSMGSVLGHDDITFDEAG